MTKHIPWARVEISSGVAEVTEIVGDCVVRLVDHDAKFVTVVRKENGKIVYDDKDSYERFQPEEPTP